MLDFDKWSPLVLSAVATLPLLVVYGLRAVEPGFRWWVTGTALLCAAGAAQSLAPWLWPGALGKELVGGLLLFSYYAFYAGCRRQRERPQGLWLVALGCVLLLVVSLGLGEATSLAAQEGHLHLVELGFVVLLGASVWTLLRYQPPHFSAGDVLFAAFMALVAVYHLQHSIHWVLMWSADIPHDSLRLLAVSGFKAVGFSMSVLLLMYEQTLWKYRQAAAAREELARRDTFEALFEHAPVALVYGDAGGIRQVNHHARQLLGLPGNGLLHAHKLWQKLYPQPTRRRAAQAALERCLRQARNGDGQIKSTEFKTDDGPNGPVSLLVSGKRAKTGELLSLVDISSLRQLQERLRVSEERYTLAMQASRDGIWDWNCRDDSVFYGGAYLDMLGYAVGQDTQTHLQQFVALLHPDDREPTMDFVRHCMAHEDSFEVEFRMRHRSGEAVWILSRAQVVERSATGQALRVVGAHSDITLRKTLELNLKASLEQQRTLLQAAPLGICHVLQGRIQQCNARMNQLFETLPQVAAGAALFELIPEADLQRLEQEAQACTSALTSGRSGVISLERAFRGNDGQLRWYRIYGQSIAGGSLWDDGVLVVQDVSERHNMLEQLVRSRDAANSAARAAQGLLANMRHEVNTPLNAVLGFSELIGMTCAEEEVGEWARNIHQEGQRLRGLLIDVQALASAYAQPLEPRQLPLDLEQLCRDCVQAQHAHATEKGLVLAMSCEAPSGPLAGDVDLLAQAVRRLLDNAIRFTASGCVQLSLHSRSLADQPDMEEVRVEVQDTGPGVPADQQPQLFRPFLAGNVSDLNQGGGLGLGLAMVQRIALALGGHTDWGPGEAGGSVFGFTVRLQRLA